VLRRATTVAALVAIAAACRSRSTVLPDPETANAAVVQWRAKHEADYRREWVSIAGLHMLKPGSNTAGSTSTNDIVLPASTPSTIGRFTLDGGRVVFEPQPGAAVQLEGKPVVAPIVMRDDSHRDAEELVIGDVRLVVHVTGERHALRVRDPNGRLAKAFAGFTWFPIDTQYRALGRFIRDPQPRQLKVVNTYGDADEYTTEGVVEFTLFGQTLRLRPFTTRPKRLYFVFRDASSGQETYETARFLYSDLGEDGKTVLDFNEAYNPPCAFNPLTTCPIPLRENHLPVKMLAGEKRYEPAAFNQRRDGGDWASARARLPGSKPRSGRDVPLLMSIMPNRSDRLTAGRAGGEADREEVETPGAHGRVS
jgi:uncharacterized protein